MCKKYISMAALAALIAAIGGVTQAQTKQVSEYHPGVGWCTQEMRLIGAITNGGIRTAAAQVSSRCNKSNVKLHQTSIMQKKRGRWSAYRSMFVGNLQASNRSNVHMILDARCSNYGTAYWRVLSRLKVNYKTKAGFKPGHTELLRCS